MANNSVKGSSPVQFFDQKLKDRNQNWSKTVPSVGGTEQDLLGVGTIVPLHIQARSIPELSYFYPLPY
jgi:hypothetical protein